MFDADSRETSKQMDDAEKGSNHMNNYSILLVLVKTEYEDDIRAMVDIDQVRHVLWLVQADKEEAISVLDEIAEQNKKMQFDSE
jgi:hypothetical protein